jgi:hypothetical protein
MRIWSKVLTARDFNECAREVNHEFPGADVYATMKPDDDPTHITRGTYAGCTRYDHVYLRSTTGRYHPNPGASRDREWCAGQLAASWTEWGWWLVRLFERDPNARCGEYHGLADFHDKTQHRFRDTRTARERQVKRTLTRTS